MEVLFVTVPEYVISSEPTVPNWMAFPFRVPLMLRVAAGSESWMLPLSVDPDSCHVSVNDPE
jgi:hypothetical protein